MRMVYAIGQSADRCRNPVPFVCMRSSKTLLRFPLILLTLSIPAFSTYAQTSLIPVVTVQATDPLATWSGDTGTFTVYRDGPTNQMLNIFYLLGGTATNGVDYSTIGNWITIAAGVRTNTVTVTPIDHGQA